MNVQNVLKEHEKAVVIAHFKPDCLYNGGHAPQNPACLLQITLIASKVSPSGHYLRLGETSGDEIVGWTNIETLEIDEILGELSEDGKTVIPIETLPLPVGWPPRWSLEARQHPESA